MYCSKCGSPVDPETKKCTGCGKQYFNIHKLVSWKIISIILFICLCISFGYAQHWHSLFIYEKEEILSGNEHIHKLDAELKEYKNLYSDQTDKIKDLEEKNEKLLGDFSKASWEAFWYEQHAGICTPGGNKYHTYDCYHWKNSDSFWIYNIEAAEQRGYEPCLDCH